MRRLLAAVVIVALSFSAASMTCAGWQVTAAARMACCLSAHDGCVDQVAADACCARTEESQQPLVFAMPATPVPVVTVALAPPHLNQPTRHAAAIAFELALQRYPHTPPFLSTILLV
jgi:hypothetical protein